MAIVDTEPVNGFFIEKIEVNGKEVDAFEAECPICSDTATGIVVRAEGQETRLKFDWQTEGQDEGCDHLYTNQTWSADDFEGSCLIYFGGVVDREADDPRFDPAILKWLGSDRYYLRHWS